MNCNSIHIPVNPIFFLFSERKGAGNPIRYTFEGCVEDLLTPSQPNTLYYLEVSNWRKTVS